MTLTITLHCQGKDGTCDATYIQVGGTPSEARRTARAGGWHAPHGGRDMCPSCYEACRAHATPPPTGPCPSCARRTTLEFAAALGHDRTGHQAANVLARHGITTWRHLAPLTVDDLLALPGMGQSLAARVVTVQHLYQRGDRA